MKKPSEKSSTKKKTPTKTDSKKKGVKIDKEDIKNVKGGGGNWRCCTTPNTFD